MMAMETESERLKITVNNETNTFYYIQDHLGSTRLVTDSNGTPLTSVEYYPFGRHEYSGSQESYLFTGKEKDATGLSYFGARYYDPETGRFLTRDPYTFLPDDPRANASAEDLPQWLLTPQRFNRFSYAGNNPLKYIDFTGLSFECIDPECQELLEEKEDKEKREGQPEQQGNSLVQSQEECKKKCMRMGNIRRMAERRKQLKDRENVMQVAAPIVCGLLGIFTAGTVGIICNTVAFFAWVDIYQEISEIENEIGEFGCACILVQTGGDQP
jgi:RHS repeat-associated protein